MRPAPADRVLNAAAALVGGLLAAWEFLRCAPTAPALPRDPEPEVGPRCSDCGDCGTTIGPNGYEECTRYPTCQHDAPMPAGGFCPVCEQPVLPHAGPHACTGVDVLEVILAWPTEVPGAVLVTDLDCGNPAVWAS